LPNWFWTDDDKALLCEPDTEFTYSGLAYMYLQRVVERVVGLSLNEWADQTILRELKMSMSSYVWKSDFGGEAAKPHDANGEPVSEHVFSEPKSASSLYTTAHDYGYFLAELTSNDDDIEAILSSTTNVEGNVEWGLGWGVEHTASGTLLFHWGDNPGYNCFTLIDTARNTSAVVFTNSQAGRRAYSRVLKAWCGHELTCLRWLEGRYRAG
jgi:CubicO group peptidase (beta-lactamase class C family)